MFKLTVVFPSLGEPLPTAMTRGGESTARNCRFVRIFRKASAGAEERSENSRACFSRKSLLKGTKPMTPELVSFSRDSPFRMVLSSESRRSARPKPNSKPRMTPRARLRIGLGTTGSRGAVARCSTTTRASGMFPTSGVSRSRIITTNSSERALTISRAAWGDSSKTDTLIKTVFGFDFALTLD